MTYLCAPRDERAAAGGRPRPTERPGLEARRCVRSRFGNDDRPAGKARPAEPGGRRGALSDRTVYGPSTPEPSERARARGTHAVGGARGPRVPIVRPVRISLRSREASACVSRQSFSAPAASVFTALGASSRCLSADAPSRGGASEWRAPPSLPPDAGPPVSASSRREGRERPNSSFGGSSCRSRSLRSFSPRDSSRRSRRSERW